MYSKEREQIIYAKSRDSVNERRAIKERIGFAIGVRQRKQSIKEKENVKEKKKRTESPWG